MFGAASLAGRGTVSETLGACHVDRTMHEVYKHRLSWLYDIAIRLGYRLVQAEPWAATGALYVSVLGMRSSALLAERRAGSVPLCEDANLGLNLARLQ